MEMQKRILCFSTLYPKWQEFQKKIIDDKNVFFSTALVKNISHSKKNSRRYYHKCKWVFI